MPGSAFSNGMRHAITIQNSAKQLAEGARGMRGLSGMRPPTTRPPMIPTQPPRPPLTPPRPPLGMGASARGLPPRDSRLTSLAKASVYEYRRHATLMDQARRQTQAAAQRRLHGLQLQPEHPQQQLVDPRRAALHHGQRQELRALASNPRAIEDAARLTVEQTGRLPTIVRLPANTGSKPTAPRSPAQIAFAGGRQPNTATTAAARPSRLGRPAAPM